MNGHPTNQASARARHILVVEDDADVRQLNSEVLLRSGYAVDVARDGEAAWDALSSKQYDLMIADHTMPKVSRAELLFKLRKSRMALPVILTTGTWPKKEFNIYPWLQPAAMLLKPYTVEELLGTVKDVLRENGSRS